MTFRNKLQYFLVKKLQISNKEAIALIASNKVIVNGENCNENIILQKTDHVLLDKILLQEGKRLTYYAFNKPKGIETTLNENISNNLKTFFSTEYHLFPIGRLDKESEGLLIMTNDGDYYNQILKNDNTIEKEYLVKVNKSIEEDFVQKMSNGIKIMGKTTLPCVVEKISDDSFRIVLKQGLNRQIRRMCYKLNYEVLFLQRIRIDKIKLGDLEIGETRMFSI
ncbi:MAG: pseudouridine synthase [Pseudarcicella sp.]|nr:pseudouridine synthase [Pseudarcicella sp.]MBP6411160.1 pseudouridine synthase [Pseudarcicella sp.]